MLKTTIIFIIWLALLILGLWYLHYIRIVRPENKIKKHTPNKILNRYEKIIDEELNKEDNSNFDLIEEYTNKIIELKGLNTEHNANEIKEKIMKGEILWKRSQNYCQSYWQL